FTAAGLEESGEISAETSEALMEAGVLVAFAAAIVMMLRMYKEYQAQKYAETETMELSTNHKMVKSIDATSHPRPLNGSGSTYSDYSGGNYSNAENDPTIERALADSVRTVEQDQERRAARSEPVAPSTDTARLAKIGEDGKAVFKFAEGL